MRPTPLPLLFALLATAVTATAQKVGYTDTPRLPSGWHVHDPDRPRPPVVDPGPAPEGPSAVPSDAIVLFDGTSLAAWKGREGDARWKLADGYVEGNGTGDIETKRSFRDFQLHVEWAAPERVTGHSQGRGNSGVFLLGSFEVQVLDSYDNPTYADGQAAALYGQYPPLANACRKPGEWQTYDIVFHAPRFESGKLKARARVTVFHNGVLVHDDREYLGPSVHRALPTYEHAPTEGPIRLQDHGNPVRFRNLWIRPLEEG